MKITLIILMTALLGGGGFLGYRWWEDQSGWKALVKHLPSKASSASQVAFPEDTWIRADTSTGVSQSGYIRLADGAMWRFAFLSHHVALGSDSKSIFEGPSGRFRVQGGYFCCEVQFPDTTPQPKDSDAFLALLQQTHRIVESVP